jgi:hypothetical protein
VKKDLKIPWTEKLHNMLKDLRICQVLVAHACNPSYSGSRGKKKSVGRVIQGVSPEFKPQYQKKKKKKISPAMLNDEFKIQIYYQ